MGMNSNDAFRTLSNEAIAFASSTSLTTAKRRLALDEARRLHVAGDYSGAVSYAVLAADHTTTGAKAFIIKASLLEHAL